MVPAKKSSQYRTMGRNRRYTMNVGVNQSRGARRAAGQRRDERWASPWPPSVAGSRSVLSRSPSVADCSLSVYGKAIPHTYGRSIRSPPFPSFAFRFVLYFYRKIHRLTSVCLRGPSPFTLHTLQFSLISFLNQSLHRTLFAQSKTILYSPVASGQLLKKINYHHSIRSLN
jgi:hypothetical protein